MLRSLRDYFDDLIVLVWKPALRVAFRKRKSKALHMWDQHPFSRKRPSTLVGMTAPSTNRNLVSLVPFEPAPILIGIACWAVLVVVVVAVRHVHFPFLESFSKTLSGYRIAVNAPPIRWCT